MAGTERTDGRTDGRTDTGEDTVVQAGERGGPGQPGGAAIAGRTRVEELTAAGLNEVLVCEAPGSVSVSGARGVALGEQEAPAPEVPS